MQLRWRLIGPRSARARLLQAALSGSPQISLISEVHVARRTLQD